MYFVLGDISVSSVTNDTNSGYPCGGKDAETKVVDDEGYGEPPNDCELTITQLMCCYNLFKTKMMLKVHVLYLTKYE